MIVVCTVGSVTVRVIYSGWIKAAITRQWVVDAQTSSASRAWPYYNPTTLGIQMLFLVEA